MKSARALVWIVSLVCLIALPVSAAVKRRAGFGDNMVLQRGQALPIWGWDDPGTEVTVTLGEAKATAKADANGKFMVKLPAMKAGGPHTMTIAGTSSVTV